MKSLLASSSVQKWIGLALVLPLATLNVVRADALPITSQSQEASSVDQAAIDRAVAQATFRIEKLAVDDPAEFASILHKAFGKRLDPNVARDLVQKAAHQQLPLPQRILFVPAEVLRGAAGAYARENGGIIFVNAQFRANSGKLPDLITHEWGHHLDAILGPGYAPGEAGQMFLTGVRNSGPIFAALQNGLTALENHHATIEFEGRTIPVELGFFDFIAKPFKAVANAVKKAADWTGGALQTIGKATVKIGTAIGNNIKDRVVTGFNAVKNGVTTLGHTLVGVGQGIASGVTAGLGVITGSQSLKDKSADLASNARGSFKAAGDSAKKTAQNVLDNVKAINKLFDDTKVALNEAVPHLGTALDIMADFSPIGAAKGLASGVEKTGDAIQNGESFGNILQAGSGLLLAGAGKGLGKAWELKKASDLANKLKNAEGLAELNKLNSLKLLEPSKWQQFKTVVTNNKDNLIKLKDTAKEVGTFGGNVDKAVDKIKADMNAGGNAPPTGNASTALQSGLKVQPPIVTRPALTFSTPPPVVSNTLPVFQRTPLPIAAGLQAAPMNSGQTTINSEVRRPAGVFNQRPGNHNMGPQNQYPAQNNGAGPGNGFPQYPSQRVIVINPGVNPTPAPPSNYNAGGGSGDHRKKYNGEGSGEEQYASPYQQTAQPPSLNAPPPPQGVTNMNPGAGVPANQFTGGNGRGRRGRQQRYQQQQSQQVLQPQSPQTSDQGLGDGQNYRQDNANANANANQFTTAQGRNGKGKGRKGRQQQYQQQPEPPSQQTSAQSQDNGQNYDQGNANANASQGRGGHGKKARQQQQQYQQQQQQQSSGESQNGSQGGANADTGNQNYGGKGNGNGQHRKRQQQQQYQQEQQSQPQEQQPEQQQ